ncbi:MAG: flippase [Patescibacteria group bacterium]|nr:flippase [Patescibacteria group bacterium]MCL5224327.1 flippase [Patescibacteria group bacterium]
MWQKIKSFLVENRTTKQTVAKNTVWLSISNFGGRLLKAVIVIYGARVLSTAGYGVFSYAVTLAGFFTLFVDPGINAILVREGSKASPEERQSLFATTLIMKAVVLALSVVVILTVAPLFSILPGAKALIPFIALIIVFDSSREFLASFFRAGEKMQWDAASFLIENLGIVVFGFIFLAISATPLSFTKSYVLGTAVGALAAAWLLRRNFTNILAGASVRKMIDIIKVAWPFAVTSALGILLTNTDILIISWMRNASDVGIYSAAIRIIQVLYIVPTIIQFSTLPLLSRLAKRDPDKFRIAFERITSSIFLVSIPLSVGGIILSNGIMGLIFGPAYAGGGTAFAILMLGLSFDYTACVIANGIFAHNHQKSLIVSSAIGGFGNVLLDLLLIPPLGIVGSSIATLLAQILSNSYLWYAMGKLNSFHVLPKLKRIVAASLVMAAVTWLLATLQVNIIGNIVVSGIVYSLMLLLTKEPLVKEIKELSGFANPSEGSSV